MPVAVRSYNYHLVDILMCLQVRNNEDSYSGDYDAIAVVVGANNLGNYAVQDAVAAVDETVEILRSLNPRACVFACEVCNLQDFLIF